MGLEREMARYNLITSASRIAAYLLVFLFGILIARMLGPEGFGVYSFFLSVAGFFLVFTDLGMSGLGVRFIAEYQGKREYGKSRTLLNLLVKYRLVLVSLLIIVVAPTHRYIADAVFSKPELSWVILLSLPLVALHTFSFLLSSMLSALKDFKAAAAYVLLENLLRFVLVLGPVAVGFGVFGALVGTVAVYAVLVAAVAFHILRKYASVLRARPGPVEGRKIKTFGVWLMGAAIIGSVYESVGHFIVAALLPVEELGFYRIAVGWAVAASGLIPVATTVVYTYLSSSSLARAQKILYHSVRYVYIFSFPVAFILSALSEHVVSIFYGAEFTAATVPMQIVAFSAIPISVLVFFYNYYTAIDKPQMPVKVSVASTVVTVVLLVALTKAYGIAGAAIAMLVGRVLEMVFLAAPTKIAGVWNGRMMAKPLLASIVVYYAASYAPVSGVVSLFLTGAALAVLYGVVMLAIGGVTRQDAKLLLSTVRR